MGEEVKEGPQAASLQVAWAGWVCPYVWFCLQSPGCQPLSVSNPCH